MYISDIYHSRQAYYKVVHIKYDLSCQPVIINYVSKHQLPYVIDISHITPTIM